MASITLYIQGKRNPTNIYVRLTQGTKIDCKAPTKFVINPKDWSKAKQRPGNLKDSELSKLNEDLEILQKNLLSYYNKSISENTQINTLWLRGFIDPVESAPNSISAYMRYYIELRGSQLKPRRKTQYNDGLTFLEEFEIKTKKKYNLVDFDQVFKSKIYTYGQSVGFAPNTIAVYFSSIRTAVNHADKAGMNVSKQLRNIDVKFHKNEHIIYLDFRELETIEGIKLNKINPVYRDWLILSCELGQRFSDLIRLNKSMIRNEVVEIEGKKVVIPLIEFTQDKTKKIMSIPLSKKVIEVLAKNGGNFPEIRHEEAYNEKIKMICKQAGFTSLCYGSIYDPNDKNSGTGARKRKTYGDFEKWQLISSHIGRRSFATNYYGIYPTPLLMSVTGHKTEASFLRYIGKTSTQKAVHLARLMYGG